MSKVTICKTGIIGDLSFTKQQGKTPVTCDFIRGFFVCAKFNLVLKIHKYNLVFKGHVVVSYSREYGRDVCQHLIINIVKSQSDLLEHFWAYI